MKLTLPFWNRAVSGTLPGIGTFRTTARGAVLAKQGAAADPRTPAQTTARHRLRIAAAEWIGAIGAAPETINAFIARRLTAAATTSPAIQPGAPLLTTTHPTYTPALYLPPRTQPRKPAP